MSKLRFWLLFLVFVLPLASLHAQDTDASGVETFNYQGQDYPIYLVPTDDGVMHQWALVKKGRKVSQFIDPANPDAGLIDWAGNWRALSPVFPPSELPVIPTAIAEQMVTINVEGPDPQRFQNISLEKAILAPDGSSVAGVDVDGLCIYTFNDDTKKCFAYPDGFSGPPRTIYWSPDSTMLAFTEDVQVFLQESDIWVFDTTTGSYADVTDDQITGNLADPNPPSSPLDYIPTWNPVNDDLYFIRSESSDDRGTFSTSLYRLSVATQELKAVADLTSIVTTSPWCEIADAPLIGPGLNGVMTISPDGATLAILVRHLCSSPQIDENSGIWLLNLADESAPRLLVSQSELQSGMPSYRQDIPLIPSAVAWVAGGDGLLVTGSNLQYAIVQPANMAYYVDAATGTAAPVLDYSVAKKDELDFSRGTAYDVPFGFGVSADGRKLIMMSSIPAVSILTLDLPPDGKIPIRIYTNPDLPKGLSTRFSTTGADGKMLIAGFLVTIHP